MHEVVAESYAALRQTAEQPAVQGDVSHYTMKERSGHRDFGLRDERTALPNSKAHRHDYFQIHVQLAGHTCHYIGESTRRIAPGTICFIAPFKPHFIPTVPNSRYYILNASAEYFLPALREAVLELDQTPLERAPELAPFRFQEGLDFVLSDADLEAAHRLCQAMAIEESVRSAASPILLRAYLLQLIGVVWRAYESPLRELSTDAAQTSIRRRPLASLSRFLREHLHQAVGLQETAQAVHLSPGYLSQLIKKETGQSFVQFLTARRIAQARSLLLHSDLSIKEVAARCGFDDIGYFGRRFRKIEGCSPSEFRETVRRP
jgi:AraC-like DNA-binding protein